jgi:hypothetical protein
VVNSSISISGIAQHYNLFNQTETITAQVSAGALTVNQGQVTFTDGGQSHTVNVTNSSASTTFTFPFFSEIPAAHNVTANFADNTTGVPFNFGSSSTSATAPDSTLSYLFQLTFDYYLAVAFTAAVSSSTSGG